jgi:hypothetical protein
MQNPYHPRIAGSSTYTSIDRIYLSGMDAFPFDFKSFVDQVIFPHHASWPEVAHSGGGQGILILYGILHLETMAKIRYSKGSIGLCCWMWGIH